MKKLVLICTVSLFMYACNDQATGDTNATADSAVAAAAITYPYTASYSSSFTMGNPGHCKIVLDLWKHWDNNTLDQGSGLFADSVTMQLADGSVMSGPRDSILAGAKQYRSQFKSVQSTVIAFVPMKSTDKGENWVNVWGREFREDMNGKKDSSALMESWRLNNDGKINFMVQYDAKLWPTPPSSVIDINAN